MRTARGETWRYSLPYNFRIRLSPASKSEPSDVIREHGRSRLLHKKDDSRAQIRSEIVVDSSAVFVDGELRVST